MLKPSRESWKRVLQSGWFNNDENLDKYYHNRIYPDLEYNGKQYESIEDLQDAVKRTADKAWKDKHARKKALQIVSSVEPYHVAYDKQHGLSLVADKKAVNAAPQGGTAPESLPSWILKGENLGENIMKDGILLGNPRIVKSPDKNKLKYGRPIVKRNEKKDLYPKKRKKKSMIAKIKMKLKKWRKK